MRRNDTTSSQKGVFPRCPTNSTKRGRTKTKQHIEEIFNHDIVSHYMTQHIQANLRTTWTDQPQFDGYVTTGTGKFTHPIKLISQTEYHFKSK